MRRAGLNLGGGEGFRLVPCKDTIHSVVHVNRLEHNSLDYSGNGIPPEMGSMGKESKYMKNSTSKVITRNRNLNVESENVGVTPGSITHLPCVLGPVNQQPEPQFHHL